MCVSCLTSFYIFCAILMYVLYEGMKKKLNVCMCVSCLTSFYIFCAILMYVLYEGMKKKLSM